MGYQYSYLLMGIVLLIILMALFIWRKDNRKEILYMGILFGIIGLITGPIYSNDWWKPLTITNTIVSIEDFLFGFAIGGISSVIYEDIFRKRIKLKKTSKKTRRADNKNFLYLTVFLLALFATLFYIFKMHTFYASTITLLVALSIVYAKRPDLIKNSVFTALMILIIAFAVHTLVEAITPGWVQATWYFEKIPNIVIFNVQIYDLIWYALTGACVGPLYEYWKEGKEI